LHFVLQNDEEGIARIGKAYLDTLDATEADKRTSWSATLEDYRISYGKNGNLNNLRKLVAINPNNAEVLSRMANAYASLEDFLQSARSYEAASACANTPKNADYYLGQAAIQYAKAKAFKESQALVEKLRTDAQDPERELSVLRTLWTLAELEKDDDAEVVVMERIVDISPDDFGTRFSLAYKHSEMGSNDLAFHHYLKIPYSERNETTWNNLGVSYKHFSMPAKSVLAYRKAEQMGETLAMANLGYLYMNAGFTEEAREQLDKALATDDPHKNVSLAYAALKDIPDAEEEKKKEVLQRAAPKTEFYRRCGRAIVEPEIRQIRPTWRGPKCDFQVTLRDGRFHATGKYEQDATNYLASAFGGPLKAVDRYEIEINGIVRGRLIEGTVKRTRNGKPPQGLLEIGSGETKALILLSGNDIDLDIMEGSNSLSPSFYSLHVI
jgi:tetratricopeptide (TPR) repeat protein